MFLHKMERATLYSKPPPNGTVDFYGEPLLHVRNRFGGDIPCKERPLLKKINKFLFFKLISTLANRENLLPK